MLFSIFLQHQRRTPVLQPAPAYFAVAIRSPLLRDLKTQTVHVKAQGHFHAGDTEERYGLLDVGFNLGLSRHIDPA
jgi:hypothetical protein